MNAIHAPGVVLALLILTAAPAEATVVDAAAGGFTVRQTVEVSASAAAAYRTLVDRVGEWWQSDHTFSGSAANLSIDARPGGCFCEKLPGAMTWRFTESRGKTTIEMIYKVGGYAPGGFAALAPVVDMVLGTQVGRLKLLIDIGHAQ
ncbi:MAG TPA: hypothetical protein VGJ78_06270 [Vicinamibacterales bacterium]|jgi:hypothetical protein